MGRIWTPDRRIVTPRQRGICDLFPFGMMQTSGGTAAPFTPAAISKLVAWYEPSDVVSIQTGVGGAVSNGGACQKLLDRGPNGLHATTSSTTTTRTDGAFGSSTITGLTYAAGAALITPNLPLGSTNAAEVWYVFKGGSPDMFWPNPEVLSGGCVAASWSAGSTVSCYWNDTAGGGNAAKSGSHGVASGALAVMRMQVVMGSGGDALITEVNGSVLTMTGTGTSHSLNFATAPYGIGFFFVGKFGFCAFFNATLTTTEAANMRTYLSKF